ncbi:7-carboxy-7-deazaguanine synthase QueE [Mesorhizobium sp.]|uniref:7-carboxy-7-deazaguanine synthase QueE n=1 Tax=Mesorhizobium sp. TaxID=1871066 RepID=UPI000FEA40AC|nr:7-carboxy-7-deazaguanine synthase QueE [Mesorhizobium sp.]RWM25577.1 MAG: 7-carboxy-7-deazaguanine synthase QueE [Mesorhizobium sp.]RWM38833.1 MAG: 7-carboxy-7-deazaguanine synthase QueE [Mesorhizobium sp.]TJV51464.1 MAG: 7-carboxy-7-deazaguanine synthase QueE [Mesorhizobium sp.]
MKGSIRISEIFGPTVQGEGPLIGRPTVFVRTGGCDYRCRWCDTLYAVLPEFREDWALMTPTAILTEVERLSNSARVLVSLSGGNPALQPLAPLIEQGHKKGHTFALETQGSVSQPWFAALDWLILSPKPPSSGMVTDWPALDDCAAAARSGTQCVVKVAVFDDNDYAFARFVANRYPTLPVYLQVGNPAPLITHTGPGSEEADIDDLMRRFRWLVDKVAADGWFTATVLPQLHVLAWGNRRGV